MELSVGCISCWIKIKLKDSLIIIGTKSEPSNSITNSLVEYTDSQLWLSLPCFVLNIHSLNLKSHFTATRCKKDLASCSSSLVIKDHAGRSKNVVWTYHKPSSVVLLPLDGWENLANCSVGVSLLEFGFAFGFCFVVFWNGNRSVKW